MIEYRHPVSIKDTDKFPKLQFVVNMYDETDGMTVFIQHPQEL
jgi:hypothetical protein